MITNNFQDPQGCLWVEKLIGVCHHHLKIDQREIINLYLMRHPLKQSLLRAPVQYYQEYYAQCAGADSKPRYGIWRQHQQLGASYSRIVSPSTCKNNNSKPLIVKTHTGFHLKTDLARTNWQSWQVWLKNNLNGKTRESLNENSSSIPYSKYTVPSSSANTYGH